MMDPEQQVRGMNYSATLNPSATQTANKRIGDTERGMRKFGSWAWNQYSDLSNAIPPSVDMGLSDVPMMVPVVAGAVRKAPGISKIISKIHPEDLDEMETFINSVRLKKQNPQAELSAARIAEHYNLPMPKTTAGLANSFDNMLQTYVQGLEGRK